MQTYRKIYWNHQKKLNNTNALTNLIDMFPDWESEELQNLLNENNNSPEIVIDLIVNNKVAKWESIKKEKKKKDKDQTFAELNSISNQNNITAFGTVTYNKEGNTLNGFQKNTLYPSNKKTNKSTSKTNTKKNFKNIVHKKSTNSSLQSESLSSINKSPSKNGDNLQITMKPNPIAVNTWASAILNKTFKSHETKDFTTNEQKIKQDVFDNALNTKAHHQKLNNKKIDETNLNLKTVITNDDTKSKLKESSYTQSQSESWVSAIKPKYNHLNKTKFKMNSLPTTSNAPPISLTDELYQENDLKNPSNNKIQDSNFNNDSTTKINLPSVTSNNTSGNVETSILDEKKNLILSTSSSINFNAVGISFGSLSVNEQEQETNKLDIKDEITHIEELPKILLPITHPIQSAQKTQQSHTEDDQHSLSHTPSQSVSQTQQQRFDLYNPQSRYNQNIYQPHYNQQTQPYYDYYGQMQHQQYNQQGNQGIPEGHFGGYFGIDYSAFNNQAAGLNGIASSATNKASTANYGHFNVGAQRSTQSNANNLQESTKSPVLKQGVLQQQQQQIPTPFGYPYYNYYYNAPFYGTGATGLRTNQNSFGYGVDVSPNSNNVNVSSYKSTNSSIPQIGASNTTGTNTANNGFSGGIRSTPLQYYGHPNQYNAKYLNYNYPQKYVQPGQQIQANPQFYSNNSSIENKNQLNQPNVQTPQNIFPQQPIMPQYGGYQHYHQCGFQDNGQYRGWF